MLSYLLIMSCRLESALYLTLTRLSFSSWVVHQIHCNTTSTVSRSYNNPTLVLPFFEPCPPKPLKNINLTRCCVKNISDNHSSETSVDSPHGRYWKHSSVSKHWERGSTTVHEKVITTASHHLCGALEKLIRLLILVAIWVRWSYKGIHIVRINKQEWQTA